MNSQLEKYFIPNENASYIASNGERRLVAAITYKGKKQNAQKKPKNKVIDLQYL